MELKPVYKRTVAGVVPEDWVVCKLGEIASIAAGGTPSRNIPAYWNGRIPWVTTSQIDFNTITDAQECITGLGLKNSAATLLAPGTLLLALYGQGKTRGKVGILGIKATTNQACASIVISPALSSAYVFYFLGSRYDAIRGLSNSGSQENLNGQIVKSIQIPFPPTRREQEAIADALSATDALIESLDQLIAKKRDFKQGAMQGLLTGTRRLPGFCGDWSVRPLGTVIDALDAGASVNSVDDSTAEYTQEKCILKTSAVSGGRFLPYECKKIAMRDLGRATLNPQRDTIIISRMNTPDLVGECGYVEEDFPFLFLPDRLWMTRFFQGNAINRRWLAYLLSTTEYRRQLKAAATGTSGSMKNLSKDAFLSLPVSLPKPEEQTAIAVLISDMDVEIAALETKLAKVRQIKQGMMHSLLTGRIRLV